MVAAARIQDSAQVVRSYERSIDMAGGQRRDPDGIVASRLDNRHVLVGIEFPITQKQAGDEIRRGTVATDRQLFAFEINRCFCSFASDKAQQDSIHRNRHDLDIENARGPEIEHRGYVGIRQVNVASHQGLSHRCPAGEIDRLDIETMLAPKSRFLNDVIQILGDSRAAVTQPVNRLLGREFSSNPHPQQTP